MYGVIIEEGPENWQIFQQKDGFAEVSVSGRIEVESDVSDFEDKLVILRVVDENTNSRITEPVFCELENNKFNGMLRIPAGGLYRIESYLRYNKFCEKRGDRIFHIGVGDVYVITGQSNAVGVGKDVVNDPIDTNVHMFRTSGVWDIASHPLHDSTDTNYPLSQEKVQVGHSPWLNFAKVLNRHLGYPIGLIPATKGGIPLSCWDRAEDGAFFDNMLKMLENAGTDVKGVIWYQGCNDTPDDNLRNTYYERFRRVCADFEKSIRKDIPILTVQLNKSVCIYKNDPKTSGKQFAEIREAQRQAMHTVKNVYMVPTIDLPVCDGIHNASMSNMVLGERVANLALRHIYGKSVICDSPDIQKAVLETENSVRLYFRNVYDRIWCDMNRPESLMFTVSDDNGVTEPDDYSCGGDNTLLISFPRKIGSNATVNCDKYNESGLMPYDLYSYLPVIPFNNIKIEV